MNTPASWQSHFRLLPHIDLPVRASIRIQRHAILDTEYRGHGRDDSHSLW